MTQTRGRAKNSSWRPDAGPNSSIGGSPGSPCTSPHAMLGNQMPPLGTQAGCSNLSPGASQGIRVYKTAQTGEGTADLQSVSMLMHLSAGPHRSSIKRSDATPPPTLAQPHCRCALPRSQLPVSSRIETRYPAAMRAPAQCHAVDPGGEMHRMSAAGKAWELLPTGHATRLVGMSVTDCWPLYFCFMSARERRGGRIFVLRCCCC
jgi:hypothetical protein